MAKSDYSGDTIIYRVNLMDMSDLVNMLDLLDLVYAKISFCGFTHFCRHNLANHI